MIRFKTLSMRNFLSYGNVPTIVDLDRTGTTLVLGEDLDNTEKGTGSNGVGKSSIVNALVYAVYDKPLSNISKDNLVNNINKKNMEVAVEFEKDGKTYIIKRTRKAKAGAAGNHVFMYEDDKDITPDSVSHTNTLIEKIVGIPYELFVRIVTFSANHTPFLDLPIRHPTSANQTDIIEELFQLKVLTERADLLKEKIKGTERSLETQMLWVAQLEKEHERHNTQIESAERRVVSWQQQNKKEIHEIQQKLKRIEEVDIDQQRALHTEYDEINTAIRDLLSTKRHLEQQIKEHNKTIKEKTHELKHLRDDKCPYCLQAFADATQKISHCEQAVQSADIALDKLNNELDEVQNELSILSTRHKKVEDSIIVRDIDELLEIKSKASNYQSRLQQLQQQTNPYIEPLEELRSVKLDEINREAVNELKDTLDHQKFLLKLLTKKDSFVRKALLNKNIPYLNQRLAHYLAELGLPHSVEFTHEMTASISQFGRPMDFGNLSNGQRARVNIALSFAFRDVLQSMHDRINVCLLDEVLDVGMDAIGVQSAARMLKRKARDEKTSIYIISHRDEIDSAFDRKMTIQLSKGFSYIKEEE